MDALQRAAVPRAHAGRLPRIACLLRQAGVARVRIEYEGHWGFAHIDLVRYLDAHGRELTPSLPRAMIEEMEDWFRLLLEAPAPLMGR